MHQCVFLRECVDERVFLDGDGGRGYPSPSVILLSRRDNGSHGLRFNVFFSLITFLLITLNILSLCYNERENSGASFLSSPMALYFIQVHLYSETWLQIVPVEFVINEFHCVPTFRDHIRVL